mgnify:CR=1 FL=1
MHINNDGLELIKNFEGVRYNAYMDVSGIPTIGYGHTKGVKIGDSITKEKAEELLKSDLEYFENGVEKHAKKYGYNFNENEFSALVSFAYNIGSLNALTYNGAMTKKEIGDRLIFFVKSKGRTLNGLVRRRKAEQALYFKGKSVHDIALDVINGKYGNMPKRKKEIEALGYNYEEVRKEVNRIIRSI